MVQEQAQGLGYPAGCLAAPLVLGPVVEHLSNSANWVLNPARIYGSAVFIYALALVMLVTMGAGGAVIVAISLAAKEGSRHLPRMQ